MQFHRLMGCAVLLEILFFIVVQAWYLVSRGGTIFYEPYPTIQWFILHFFYETCIKTANLNTHLNVR